MATYPCMQCGQRFAGDAFNVYLQTYEGSSRSSLRKIVCGTCRDLLTLEWCKNALFRNAAGDWEDVAPDGRLEDTYVDSGGPSGWPTSRR